MQTFSAITFLKNKEIDKVRWDDCVNKSTSNLIYGRSFYLDCMANEWDALTGPDYQWVLPLTNRKKYGISYLYQPSFTQQLGVFLKPGIEVPYKAIFTYLQQYYSFCETNWNFSTLPTIASLPLQVTKGNNFILELSGGYKSICSNYRHNLHRNLKKSNKLNLFYRETGDFEKCIRLYKQHYGARMPHVNENDYINFSKLCSYASQNNMIVCREVVAENEIVLSTILLLFDGRRLYNLMPTTTEAGRKIYAQHFLLDALIKEFSGKEIILDFEGSDVPGIKSFYENFGAANEPYFKVRYNCLWWPLKLVKQ